MKKSLENSSREFVSTPRRTPYASFSLIGQFSLCALKVPPERFDEIAALVNAYPEVAHNYQREHAWNMWFVLATESADELDRLFGEIVCNTACPGLNLPKEKEFYVGLRLEA